MEACRRGGRRERLFGEDGLIGIAVLRSVRRAGLAPDIRRKWDVSYAFEKRLVDWAIEENLALAVVVDSLDGRGKTRIETHRASPLCSSARLGQREPAAALIVVRFQK